MIPRPSGPSARTAIAAAALLVVLLLGCGSGSQEQAVSSKEPTAAAVRLLDSWTGELVPTIYAIGKVSQLTRAGRLGPAVAARDRADRGLDSVLHFGRDAREALIDFPRTALVRTTVEAGDSWSRWGIASKRLAHDGGNFADATRAADLASDAIRLMRRGYRLAGEPIPPAWRTGR